MSFDTSFPKNAEKQPIGCIGMFSFTATTALLSESSLPNGTLETFTADWLDQMVSDAIWQNMPPNSPVFALQSATGRFSTCSMCSTPELMTKLNTGSKQEKSLLGRIATRYTFPDGDLTTAPPSSPSSSTTVQPSTAGRPAKELVAQVMSMIARSEWTGSNQQLFQLIENVKAFGCD